MKNILPIIAMVCTAGATLVMFVFQMAGAANARVILDELNKSAGDGTP